MKKLAGFFILCVFVSSCAYHAGLMINSASLSQNNFKIIGNVTGSSKTIYVMGFGGMATNGLVWEAKKNMQEVYPLKPGQAYTNITVDFKRSFWVIGMTNQCFINADVVQFMETNHYSVDSSIIISNSPNNLSPFGQENFKYKYSEKSGFHLNQTVYFYGENNETTEAKIIALSDETAAVTYKNAKDEVERKILPYSKIRKNK